MLKLLKRCRNLLLALAISLFFILNIVTPVFAALPPASISIDAIYVNRNLLVTGDQLYYAIYNIPYTGLPDEDIDDLFVFRLTDTDGVTELGSNEAYPYNTQGYGKGVISFYFASADAPAWGLNYFIRVQGKPGFFATPPDQSFIINVTDYTSATTQADNRAEVRNNVVTICRKLESDWSPTTLLTEIETGTVFNTYGEEYFRNSIYALQGMCPTLFETQIVNVEYTERAWNTTQQTTYEGRTTGTTIGNSIQGFSDIFDMDFNVVASLPLLAAAILCIYAAVKMNGKPEAGFLCTVALVIMGGFMGWTAFALIAVSSALCFLYIAIFLVGRIPS